MSVSVRMGEIAVSRTAGDELVALGLGSCIGLALLDCGRGVAGLVHVVLPDSSGLDGPPGKFADTAVPELIRLVRAAGAVRLEAVLGGGGRMFATNSGLDIGARNAAAVLAALGTARIPIRARAIGGSRGRTVRVDVASGTVTVREAGGEPETLFTGQARVRAGV